MVDIDAVNEYFQTPIVVPVPAGALRRTKRNRVSLEESGRPTEEIERAIRYEFTQTARAVPDGGAPAWAVDMQANLLAAQANLLAEMRALLNNSANLLAEMRALLNNSHAYNGDQRIVPVIIPGVPIPIEFPAKRKEFMALTAKQCNQLLDYYQIPAIGGVDMKRRAIGERIGLRF
eukprot:CAMPEP_0170081844 /NCGR_PEP_ID=MMETSP0019_2-20121128/17612_1 /TAXON_ID=98059 /ORGANISM="Dinobryon sp., Strain UTEXLB2267" /LENGTH=175 /DNA_ID=CAMNT_0010296481 /DNA_START=31 /DNA_END=558 /DNA_ORIENTATION=+